jgi:transmembrane sensor
MENKDAEELLKKFRAGQLTEQEKALLESWYIQRASRSEVDLSAEELEAVLQEIWDTLPVHEEERPVRRLWPRIAAAASILLILSAGGYFLLHKTPAVQQVAQNHVPDIAPGSNKAILTLANGHQIILTGAKNGQLSVQGNTTINKTADGQVVYNSGQAASSETAYNTMSTPRGGQYHLTLADGTNVWLNASSSITYPVAFNGKERKVSITGEAFFEVKHNAAQPFRVSVKGQTIEDLGTEFNINAYNDEPVVKTTLLQGSVRLTNGKAVAMMKPGQDAVTRLGNDHITIGEADTEQAVAWKNGSFIFNNEDLASIMRKVSRWYDVDIEYTAGANSAENYIGSMTRYTNVSQVLKVLEETGHVRFKIDGKKIVVAKK